MKITKTTFFSIALIISINAFTADAQTRRPLPLPTPSPGVPVIISRADDYPPEEQYVVDPNSQSDEQLREELEKSKEKIRALTAQVKSLETGREDTYDANQKRLLMNLDILSRAEQRAETLRKQLFEVIEKENAIRTRIDQINYDSREEVIRMSTATIGSLRPEEVRDARQKSLSAEKNNLNSLLSQLVTNRTSLELNVNRADALVEKIRLKLEKEIDDALNEEVDP